VLRLEGKGGHGLNGGPNGDLYITVKVESHPEFQRKGNDLYCERPVDLYTACSAGKLRIKNFEEYGQCRYSKGNTNGKMLRLMGLGMPVYGTKDEFGNLYVTVIVHLPDSLSDQEIELI